MPDTGRRIKNQPMAAQDWVFMTPAEIMGVAPEQLSRTPKRDANGQLDNLSPMERYLERQSPAARLRNNSPDNPLRSRNFWGADNGQTNGDNNDSSDQVDRGLGDLQSATVLNQSLSSAPDNNPLGIPNANSPWSRVPGVQLRNGHLIPHKKGRIWNKPSSSNCSTRARRPSRRQRVAGPDTG